MLTEVKLSNWLYQAKKKLSNYVQERVENPFCVGMPDLSCCYNDKDFWIELKVGKLLKNNLVNLTIRKSQIDWHNRRGNNCFFLIGIENEGNFILKSKNLFSNMKDSNYIDFNKLNVLSLTTNKVKPHELILNIEKCLK